MKELARSIPVSLLSFGLDFALLVLLTEVFHVPYLVSAAFSFLLGVTASYVLSILWVFGARRMPSRAAEYGLFVFVGLVGLGLNEALLWLFTEPLGLYYMLSKCAAGGLVFFWNFGTRKLILFR